MSGFGIATFSNFQKKKSFSQQLILENAKLQGIDDALIDQIFDLIIRDFSKYALQLYTKGSTTLVQQRICKLMVKRPVVDKKRFSHVWETYVSPLKDQYEMNS